MSPLSVEVYREDQNEWVGVGEINPGNRPGSISDNKPDESRDLYIFECSKDDSQSTIYRSKGGVDTEKGDMRAVIALGGLSIVKELKRGESYEMKVRTDVGREPRKIRFSHK